MKKIFERFSYPYYIWTLATILVPIFLIVYYSVIDKSSGAFSIINFKNSFSPEYIQIFIRSLGVSILTTIICLVIGYPVALFLSRVKPANQQLLLFLFILPTWTNIVLRTYAWLIMFYRNGIIENFLKIFGLNFNLQYSVFAVYVGMVYNYLPFMILPLYTAISKIDGALLEAGEDLGASKWQRLVKIIVPLSAPGIISGIIMVFLPAATTFVIPQILSAGKYNLIGNVIERQFTSANNQNFGSALSIILIIIIVISIFALDLFNQRDTKKSSKRGVKHVKK